MWGGRECASTSRHRERLCEQDPTNTVINQQVTKRMLWNQRASVQQNSHQSSDKATSRMGKNLYHLDIWQRLSKIYKKCKQKNKPNLKWSIKLNREISKQEIQRANKYVFKYSISLAIRDMQMKTTLRFHFTPVKITMVFFFFLRTTNAGVYVKRRNTFTVGGSTNWCFHFVTQCEVP